MLKISVPQSPNTKQLTVTDNTENYERKILIQPKMQF